MQFTFHWSELLIVVLGGLALLVGLAFLMLRRRNEVLQKFLTPEEPDLEEEFFRIHYPEPEEMLPEDDGIDQNGADQNEHETEAAHNANPIDK